MGWPDDPYCPITPAVDPQPAVPDSKPGFVIVWAAAHVPPPPPDVTLSVSVAVCEPIPVIVTLSLPAAADEDAANVTVEDEPELTVDGLNDAVTRLGRPLALSATESELPEVTAVETVAVAFEPAATLTFVGLTETEKSLEPVDAGPNAAAPFGVPSPVGPSYPTPAVQRSPSVEFVDQTDSVQPRALLARERAVPPTAVTYCDAAGYSRV